MKSTHSQQKEREKSSSEQLYAELTNELLKFKDVSLPIGRKGFGSSALWVSGKIFAFLSTKGEFVVKLPVERVNDFLEKGSGKRFDTGRGREMKQWLVVNEISGKLWLSLSKEAMEFVRKTENKK